MNKIFILSVFISLSVYLYIYFFYLRFIHIGFNRLFRKSLDKKCCKNISRIQ